ncbi:hypothetical protein Salat_2393800 [Sesamum alatum]|uniref:Uncharacterized protein n=1 Tax=Sesamum alatum TaxID=300844 RepID=A0AAE2CF31_9LAMI|nr:hypothetical protein Salat_2393800 [Sesamum alatum]
MGDKATLAKARKELEELYLGVPDESVNLTFQDLAQVRQNNADKKRTSPSPSPSPVMETIVEKSPSPLAKLPSLDFNKAFEMEALSRGTHSNYYSHRDLHHHRGAQEAGLWPGPQGHHQDHHGGGGGDQRSMVYDDVSGVSVNYGMGRGGRRRPGIPHSNICTICCNYIYICRHRCLVCGRVYCRQCVSMGMGEMPEGRKCIECLGRRFSQRYIQKAGNVGCCMGYSSTVKQQELKWAEKGPRRSGENRYSNMSMMASRTRSPVVPTTPSRPHSASNPPSFVMSSPYSPTSHHPLPF